MLKWMTSIAAVGLLAAAALAASPEQPPLPTPETALTAPTPATPLVPVPDSQPSAASTLEPIVLYTNVKYEDGDNVPKCAVPIVVAIPDPCLPGCCRYIEICAVPDCEPKIHSSPSGRKIQYDYGSFEVEIYNRSKYVVVNYDD
ncbi:MAG: hypothetical protein JNG89_04290 [Planctomycetaceae bacterium]|nr:hypothetical protein [Planctomycetaceae bacterium]